MLIQLSIARGHHPVELGCLTKMEHKNLEVERVLFDTKIYFKTEVKFTCRNALKYRVGNQNFPQVSCQKQTNNGLAHSHHSDIS